MTVLRPGKSLTMHRLIMGAQKGEVVDHINGNRLDNRRCNLRLVTHSQNAMNTKTRTDATSGHRGINFNKESRKWVARIQVEGRRIYLGKYNDIKDAIAARQAASLTYFGEFARVEHE